MKKAFMIVGALFFVTLVIGLFGGKEEQSSAGTSETKYKPVADKLSYEEKVLQHLKNSSSRLCHAVYASNMETWMNSGRPDKAELVAETINNAVQDGCL